MGSEMCIRDRRNRTFYPHYIIGTDVVAVTLSTVAVINAVPVIVPEVNVVVAAPEAPVVNVANVKVPNVVVNVTVAPVTGTLSTVNTSTFIVAWLVPLFSIPAPPNSPWIPKLFPRLLGPTKSSTTAWQPQDIPLTISTVSYTHLTLPTSDLV